ncbi:MAG: NAD(P)/FAD-dependent oxidoreductase [Xenococcaceae cyanobacterium MO_188.B32]|nr:NAD(P)/FAD-dependent oxidoreductase [Xenococcaceae cyanobacterium MO_188.B32]
MTSILPSSTQVLVVGGGPAGATTAILLAREGFDVTLVEKSKGSNTKIGESLLPSALEIFDLLGIREKVEAHGFLRKTGAYFDWGPQEWSFKFEDIAVNDNSTYTFQVRRPEFDNLLMSHGKTQGVKVFQGVQIKEISFAGERPVKASWSRGRGSEQQSGEITFDYLVDASGGYGLMANHYLHNRQYHEEFENLAIWGYYKNAKIKPIQPDNATITASTKDGSGWFWGIPVDDDLLSVGLVINNELYKARRSKASMKEVFLQAIADCPAIAEVVEPAELVSKIEIGQDFSYWAENFSGPGYFLVGDAACFLDPLLSTGVHMSFFTGMMTAASISSIFRNEITEERALSFYDRVCRFHYLSLMVFVSSFYHKMHKPDSSAQPSEFIAQMADFQKVDPQMREMVAQHMSSLLSLGEEGIRLAIEQEKKGLPASALREHHEKVFAQIWNGLFSYLPEVNGLGLCKKPQLGIFPVAQMSETVPATV